MAKVTIRYCTRWGYQPRAARAAAAIKLATGLKPDLVVGNPGEFTVWVESRQVASKDGDAFPKEEDVVNAVKAALPVAWTGLPWASRRRRRVEGVESRQVASKEGDAFPKEKGAVKAALPVSWARGEGALP
jgi:hypothetical protein